MQLAALPLMFLVTHLISVMSSTAAGRASLIERDSLTNQLLKGEPLTWISTEDHQRPPIPAWPQIFSSRFYVYVEQYGSNWSSTGALYYNWTSKTFRGDYIDWCIPLFGSDIDYGSGEFNNYTCSFLATNGNMYFINHTASAWEKDECCLFQRDLGAVPPDWMTQGQYNGTTIIRDTLCDVWWFPGTNDPEKPCYSYWNAKDKENTPMRFFGLASIGPAILDYFDFKPELIPSNIDMTLPSVDCNKECEPPQPELVQRAKTKNLKMVPWPPNKWPKCE